MHGKASVINLNPLPEDLDCPMLAVNYHKFLDEGYGNRKADNDNYLLYPPMARRSSGLSRSNSWLWSRPAWRGLIVTCKCARNARL
jgi:hypothetical protein